MGCCFSSDTEGEGLLNQLVARKEVQAVEATTPAEIEVPIGYKCRVKLRLRATVDKKRTIEICWLDYNDKIKFDEAVQSILSTRYIPQNELTDRDWKTSQDYDRMADITTPGVHYLTIRSSSVLSDKNVHIKGTITKEEIR
eukprot:TRINITY_DN7895_c2_g1_i1.p1 TRINITY_DN7895_c2_g1~~TRINITY_DN7895_c2_g1_i1.p1  ORF type:complete len:157 (+),score=25.23 TRINITY_DN7895_c2_g1_i1:50-472(+)